MKTGLTAFAALLTATSAAGLAVGAETPAAAAQGQTFTLQRGENLSTLCADIRRAGVDISPADCARQILFSNRDWFDRRFGYVWEDPQSVSLDSAVRLWAGVPYVLPAGLALVETVQGDEAAQQASMPPAETKPIHPGHFDPLGKEPSTFTLELRDGLKATLPFDDQRDFEEAKKGFIAEPPYRKIMADAGHVAWDMESYDWLLDGQGFREHQSVAAAAGGAQHGLRALRGPAGPHLPGARFRPRQHHLHQG